MPLQVAVRRVQALKSSAPTLSLFCGGKLARGIEVRYAPKKLPLPFNETEWVVPFPFNNISLSVLDPFLIRSRSVRIFRPFWIRLNLFPCCAICFSAWQFMILIKKRACMLFNWRNSFQGLHQKRILFYHAKGSHVRSYHTHARSITYFASRTFLLLFLPTLS